MRLGVETMLAVLQGEQRYTDVLRYTVGLLQIEKKFRRSARLQDQVGLSGEVAHGFLRRRRRAVVRHAASIARAAGGLRADRSGMAERAAKKV